MNQLLGFFGPFVALFILFYGVRGVVDWLRGYGDREVQRRIDNNEVVAEPPY